MKKLLFALLFVFSLGAAAQTCTIRPQGLSSNHSVACSLPALQTDQCVHYVFSFQAASQVPVDVLNVKLNTSIINPVVTQSGTLQGTYSVEGRFCAAEDGTQFFFNQPSFNLDSVPSILTGPTSGTVTEDTLTQTSVLSFFYNGGRGWGIMFTGGTVDVGTLPAPLP